jgi:hypothetical protein
MNKQKARELNFNLSETKRYLGTGQQEDDIIYKQKDVKEFIRLLKIELKDNYDRCDDCIDYAFRKLAGDKLI